MRAVVALRKTCTQGAQRNSRSSRVTMAPRDEGSRLLEARAEARPERRRGSLARPVCGGLVLALIAWAATTATRRRPDRISALASLGRANSTFDGIAAGNASASRVRQPNRTMPGGSWLNASKPHVFLMLIDDAGWNDMGYQSSDLHECTPFLDELAEGGVKLHWFYGMHECTPARTALLSGRYPISTGTYHASVNFNAPWGLPSHYRLLPQYLAQLSYQTHMIGKWDVGHYHESLLPNRRGFGTFLGYYSVYVSYYEYIAELGSGCLNPNCFTDMHFSVGNSTTQVDSEGEYSTSYFGDRARIIISEHDTDLPLFLYFAPTAMHGPLSAPSHTIHKYAALLEGFGNTARREFAAALLALDETVHLIAEQAVDAGMWDNMVTIVMSDNGAAPFAARPDEPFTLGANEGSNWPLRGRKFFLWEGGTRLPAFVSSPLLPPSQKGSTFKGVFHISDWLPTIVGGMLGRGDLLGDDLDGINQWHAMLGVDPPPRNELVYNIDLVNGTIYHAAIRRGKWKFIWEFNQTWWAVPDVEYPKQTMLSDAELVDDEPAVDASPHLFNLEDDPFETRDLIADEPEVVAELVSRINELAAQMQQDGGNLNYCTGDLPRAYDIFDRHDHSVVPWLTEKDFMDECSKPYRRKTGAALSLEIDGRHWVRTSLPAPLPTPAPTAPVPRPTSAPTPLTPSPTPDVISLHPTSQFIHAAHHGGGGDNAGSQGGGGAPQLPGGPGRRYS